MLKAEALTFGYEAKVQLLRDVNIEIDEPGIYSIIGLNGSGKSTLLKLIAGILKPLSGKIIIEGKDVSKTNIIELSKIRSYLPQNIYLPIDFPVIEFIRYGAYSEMDILSRISIKKENEIKSIMEKMNIADLKKRMTSTLSAGEMQRIHIAKAILQGGKVMLMDEPVNNIDISFRRRFLNLLRDLSKDKIVIIVMHDLNIAFNMSKKILSLSNQNLVLFGSPEDMIIKIDLVYNEKINYIKNNNKYLFIDE
ncbi:MAG: hypothetical protein COX48_00815 [bacterium (Candidatus Stahlbacteria) CG23_combo_of_CG06-09_8_20_14_all_34_7]|nr:MAG: hypothetical protein COX48_00815 [bacterium (Candidatus Stahlbacteria) CG23_combo_of_CG06-09_8_20_14_all_34_7]